VSSPAPAKPAKPAEVKQEAPPAVVGATQASTADISTEQSKPIKLRRSRRSSKTLEKVVALEKKMERSLEDLRRSTEQLQRSVSPSPRSRRRSKQRPVQEAVVERTPAAIVGLSSLSQNETTETTVVDSRDNGSEVDTFAEARAEVEAELRQARKQAIKRFLLAREARKAQRFASQPPPQMLLPLPLPAPTQEEEYRQPRRRSPRPSSRQATHRQALPLMPQPYPVYSVPTAMPASQRSGRPFMGFNPWGYVTQHSHSTSTSPSRTQPTWYV